MTVDIPKQPFIEQLSPEEIACIENRMRPNAFSEEGFLDYTQSLTMVIAVDTATIHELGITYNKLEIG